MMQSVVEFAGMEYQLRYTLDDLKRCEADLGMGYLNFFKVPEKIGVTTLHPMLHRGLRRINAQGDPEYATDQFSSQGRADAGVILQGLIGMYTFEAVFLWVFKALVDGTWFKAQSASSEDPDGAVVEDAPDPLAEPPTSPEPRKKKGRA